MADTPADDRTLFGDATKPPSPNNNNDNHPVNVAEAEAAFHELERVLSVRSRSSRTENTSTHDNGKDLEKAQDAEESFNLREYLASSADRNQQAGIKHKHVGVTWEGLQVDVIGDANYKVSSELTDLFGSA